MRNNKKRNVRNIIYITVAIGVIIFFAFLGVSFYLKKQMEQIPDMSIQEMLSYTLKGEEGFITVGIIKNGVTEYSVYGRDGIVLSPMELEYEIGSITKTFTCSLLSKAIDENKVDLEKQINTYLELPDNEGNLRQESCKN